MGHKNFYKVKRFDSLDTLLKGTIAVACNDAGSANLIIDWLKAMPAVSVRAHLDGPAKELWYRVFPETVNYNINDALQGCAMLLSGTGWASNLEHNARKAALKKGVFTVAVIDQWVNYEERFNREGAKILPDEIWVVDEFGFALAGAKFPNTRIRLLPNYYMDEQVKIVQKHQRETVDTEMVNILYALEPIRQDWIENQSCPGEFQALDYLVNNSNKISNIRLRVHPSESSDKYLNWISKQNLKIHMSENNSLGQDIAWSDVVVGCQTYVLVVALTASKRVISTLPPYAPPLLLPYPEIEELRRL